MEGIFDFSVVGDIGFETTYHRLKDDFRHQA